MRVCLVQREAPRLLLVCEVRSAPRGHRRLQHGARAAAAVALAADDDDDADAAFVQLRRRRARADAAASARWLRLPRRGPAGWAARLPGMGRPVRAAVQRLLLARRPAHRVAPRSQGGHGLPDVARPRRQPLAARRGGPARRPGGAAVGPLLSRVAARDLLCAQRAAVVDVGHAPRAHLGAALRGVPRALLHDAALPTRARRLRLPLLPRRQRVARHIRPLPRGLRRSHGANGVWMRSIFFKPDASSMRYNMSAPAYIGNVGPMISPAPRDAHMGHCGITQPGHAGRWCRAKDTNGTFAARTPQACAKACWRCAKCNFISFSMKESDCSWYESCPRLETEPAHTGHWTLARPSSANASSVFKFARHATP